MRKFYSAVVLVCMGTAWVLFIYTLPLNEFPGFEPSGWKISSAPNSIRPVNFATAEQDTRH
jgi:hypothetical protein